MDASAGLWLTLVAMTLIVALRYLAVSGLFAWAAARLRPSVYAPADPRKRARLRAQIRREIGWSLASAAIYGIPAGLALWAWTEHGATRIYAGSEWPLWWVPVSIALYLLIHDAWFFWTHRAMHHWPLLFRTVHAVHHESRPPTAFASMAFHPWEAISAAWLIPALTFLVPIHWGALMAVLLIATFFGVTNHMGWEIFPRRWVHGWFGRHVITASHHSGHHSHYNSNYGLYFRFWDQWCGTDRGLSDEPLRRG
jgi:sterol desaturase/sphingolipid hydroxylase (fatty acid hydroxylase superfamily)